MGAKMPKPTFTERLMKEISACNGYIIKVMKAWPNQGCSELFDVEQQCYTDEEIISNLVRIALAHAFLGACTDISPDFSTTETADAIVHFQQWNKTMEQRMSSTISLHREMETAECEELFMDMKMKYGESFTFDPQYNTRAINN